MNKDETIAFRAPAVLVDKFEKKYSDHGKRSKILRALLQMFLDGKIPVIEYKEVEVIKS
jgi:hypothetical protein